ncbi:MAG: hypothetical protein KME16_12900 [Scytolyngbya sp. HA4215-MV1]|jgi:hypothetical protein|nr:hypothetical protein [Scytolyngbya sp. HA4215-MV1]
MQVLERPVSVAIDRLTDRVVEPTPDPVQLVEIYLGYQIFLKRLWVSGVDKGLWLHWCHPQDVGRKAHLIYGHFLPTRDMLPEILDRVKEMIAVTVKVESAHQRSSKPTSQPGLATWLKKWFK